MTTKTKVKLIPLLVTTEHKGVFFGFAPNDLVSKDKQVKLTDARLCIYWSSDVRGFMGLAAGGPTKSCKIGPSVPSITLTDVTSVTQCSDEAVKAWEKQPWG